MTGPHLGVSGAPRRGESEVGRFWHVLAVRPKQVTSLLSYSFFTGPAHLLPWHVGHIEEDLVWDVRWKLALE